MGLKSPGSTFKLTVRMSIDDRGNVIVQSPDAIGKCRCFTIDSPDRLPPGQPRQYYENIAEIILNKMQLLEKPAFKPAITDGQPVFSDLIVQFEIQPL